MAKRRADRLREHRRPRRGHRVRRRQGRGLHLEGHARLHVVHRVRSLPVAVPGLEHREAAVAQDAGDGPARARLRQGAVRCWRTATSAGRAQAEAERELVGATEGDAWWPEGGAVIDPDVLWSCTSCGACVQQCPVDIEHVDHIMDMRRYQVLVESNFPAELNQLFKGLENKGNPWNMAPNARMDWAKDLPFEVKQVGADVEDLSEVEWLFWVGCAGAYEDRAKKTTQAVAELLHMAGVDFAVLGDGETCTGDPARRSGNEFVFAAARDAERRGAQGDQGHEGRRRPARTASTRLKNEYSPVRRRARGRAPHAAAQPARTRAAPHPGGADRHLRRRPDDHLPRPVLPGPAQPGLRAAARTARRHPRHDVHRDAAQLRAVVLLRRRRGPDVDGREPSASGSTTTAPPRPSRPAPTRSRSAARSAG